MNLEFQVVYGNLQLVGMGELKKKRSIAKVDKFKTINKFSHRKDSQESLFFQLTFLQIYQIYQNFLRISYFSLNLSQKVKV